MADDFSSLAGGLDSPAANLAVVTPSDVADLAHATRSIRCAGAGDLKVTTVTGEVITISSVTAGELLPIRVIRVWATGTTITAQILALW